MPNRIMKSLLSPVVFLALTLVAGASEQAVNDLIPRLAAPNVEERLAPQNELQAMAAKASRPGAESERLALARILAAKAADGSVPQPARVSIVRQLEYIGAAESVPALTSLLNGGDAELRECARRALAVNSAADAGQTLREALAKGGESAWRIGLVDALGQREDGSAVSLITRELGDPATAQAASLALGRIGTESAIAELWKAAEKDLPGANQALAEAAGRLATKGKSKAAEAICVRLLKKDLPAPIKGGALVTMARVAPNEAKPLIREALAGNNSRLQTAAISAARIAFGKSTSPTLAEWYPKLNPATKLLVLRELDSSAEKLVLGALADADESVRLVALETLGRVGGAASVPVLLKSAADSPAPFQRVANASLTRISGPGVDAALQQLAGSGDAGFRAAAIRTMGDRAQVAAVATLLKYAADTDSIVSGAACVSLGKLGGETEVEPVAKLAMSGSVPEADAALGSILSRIENKDAAATKLAAMSQQADNSHVAVLFGAMATLGGRTAMQAVLEKTSSADDGVKDAAIRALANWPDFAAVKPLLEFAAKSDTSKVHQVLALRGVARLARSSEQEAPANRVAAAQMVMKAAQRDEEKKEAIATLGAIVSPEAVAALKPLLADPAMKAEAAQAGINLAQSLRRGNRRAAEDLVKDITAADVPADLKQKAADVLKR